MIGVVAETIETRSFVALKRFITRFWCFVFLLSYALTASSGEMEVDDNSQLFIKELIIEANTLYANENYEEASRLFRSAIQDWQSPDQLRDLKIACVTLFGILYKHGQHLNESKILKERCPSETIDMLYGESDRGPVAVLRFPPKYPRAAIYYGVCGYVLTSYVVGKSGKPKKIKIIEATDKIFKKPAKESIHKYLYLPEIKDGKTVDSSPIKLQVTFLLEDCKKDGE